MELNNMIDILEKSIKELNDLIQFIDKRENHYYKQKMEFMRSIFPKTYDLKEKLKILEKNKIFYETLKKENIDISKKYFLTDNIYLTFYFTETKCLPHFYLNDDNWFYENFMDSHSGLNTWINELVMKMFDDYQSVIAEKDSMLCHDYNIMSNEAYIIENNDDANKRVNAVKNIINLVNSKMAGYDNVKDLVVRDLELKLNTMKNL